MVFVLTILTPFCAAGACAAWDRPCRSTGDTSALSLPRAAFAPLSDAVLWASAAPVSHARLLALWAWRISWAYCPRKIAVPSPKKCTSTMMAETTTRTFSVKSRSPNGGYPSTFAQAPASSMSPGIPRTSLTISITDLPPTAASERPDIHLPITLSRVHMNAPYQRIPQKETEPCGGACFRLLSAPTIVSLANSLLPRPTLYLQPSPCVRHFAHPMSLGRPNVHPGRTTSSKPDPLAPTYLEKSVTLARHPSPAQPHPIPLTSHLFPTPAPFLPINPAQSRNFASPLEAYAHTCYPRPREGPTQRPGNPTHKRGVCPRHPLEAFPVGALWK